jgi:hypothetical protein
LMSSGWNEVLLSDGRVFVAGGAVTVTHCDNEGGDCYTFPTYTTEIYTPVRGG